MNDKSVDKCFICNTEFTILRRRHHCRMCGNIMCRYCCDKIKLESKFGQNEQRVCSVCIEKLKFLEPGYEFNKKNSINEENTNESDNTSRLNKTESY